MNRASTIYSFCCFRGLTCLFVSLFFIETAKAQSSPTFSIADTLTQQDIGRHVSVFQDSTGTATFTKITQQKFIDFEQNIKSPKNVSGVYWVKLTAQNTNDFRTQRAVFFIGKPCFLDRYTLDDAGKLQIVEGGTIADWNTNYFSRDGYGMSIELLPKQTKTFYFRIVNDDFYQKQANVHPVVFSEKAYRDFKNASLRQKYFLMFFYALVLGGLMFGTVFSIFQYLFKKDGAFLSYGLVAALSLLMLLRIAEYHLEVRIFSEIFPNFFAFYYVIQYALAIAYFLFIISIFNLKVILPRLHQKLLWVIGAYLLVLIYFSWLTYLTITARKMLFTGNFILTIIGVMLLFILGYVLVSIALKKVWLSRYIISGFSLLILGYATVIYFVSQQSEPNYSVLWRIPSIYMGLGMLAEMFCFLLALSKRTQRTETERNGFEQKVKERTAELQVALKEAQVALLKGQTTERKRVASELHDNLGGLLAALKLTTYALDTHELHPQEQGIYTQIVGMIDDANRQVRSLSHNLLPEELEKEGLVSSLEKLISKLNISHKIKFSLTTNGFIERLDKQTEFNFYTIVLELCNNIIKHSNAMEASVELLQKNDNLQLLVSDDGDGFDTSKKKKEGMGMKNLYERADAVGATLILRSQKGEGTIVSLKISLPVHSLMQI